MALLAPEAFPSSSRRTLERTTFATGAEDSPLPTPEITNAGTRLEYATVGLVIDASQARPIACSPRPVAISGLPPIRSESAPASGAMKIGIAVQGSVLI